MGIFTVWNTMRMLQICCKNLIFLRYVAHLVVQLHDIIRHWQSSILDWHRCTTCTNCRTTT